MKLALAITLAFAAGFLIAIKTQNTATPQTEALTCSAPESSAAAPAAAQSDPSRTVTAPNVPPPCRAWTDSLTESQLIDLATTRSAERFKNAISGTFAMDATDRRNESLLRDLKPTIASAPSDPYWTTQVTFNAPAAEHLPMAFVTRLAYMHDERKALRTIPSLAAKDVRTWFHSFGPSREDPKRLTTFTGIGSNLSAFYERDGALYGVEDISRTYSGSITYVAVGIPYAGTQTKTFYRTRTATHWTEGPSAEWTLTTEAKYKQFIREIGAASEE